MTRKLASIQKILKIETIPNADKVELCYVLGWTVLIQKGIHSIGELIIFGEIDSIFPPKPEFRFLEQNKYRIKTMRSPRLNVISQGIIFPLSILPEGKYVEGQDVTKLLGVQKYEPPLEGGKNTQPKGVFPEHLVPKTDEIRIQAMPNLLDELRGHAYVMTNKYEGTSLTVYNWREEFGFCSRNLELKLHQDVYSRMVQKYNLDTVLPAYCKLVNRNLAIQGEICGKNVVKVPNPLDLQVDELFVFSVYDIDNRRYVDYDEAVNIAMDLGLKFVSLFQRGDSFDFTIEQLLEMAKGNYPGTKKKREGIVITADNPSVYSPSLGSRLSFKSINNEYLLEYRI